MRAAAWLLLLVGLSSTQVAADQARPPLYRVAQDTAQGTREAAGSVLEIARQAGEVATSSNWLAPCVVRLELLQRQAALIQSGQGDIDRYLRFFSVSRQVLWLNNPPGAVASKIRELETASQRLARSAGRNLDLPPISASALAPGPDPGAPATTSLPSAAQLKESVSLADSLAQSIWGDVRNQALPPGGDTMALRARQDLVGIAETLQNLRVALEEGGDARPRWHNFNENRIRFLSSYNRLPQLDQRLPRLIQALEELGENGRRTFGN